MKDERKTKAELVEELRQLRQRLEVAEEASSVSGTDSRQERQERLRQVVQHMPVMMDAFDAQGNILVWNGECERVTGFRAEEMVGNPRAMELLYPDPAYRRRMMAEWARRGDDYRDWEWEMACKDGSVKTVAWSNIAARCPVPGWATWGIGVEVTKRKRAEEALRDSEGTVRALLNAIPEVVILLDLEGTILELNEVAAARLGKPVEEFVGTCAFSLFSPELARPRRARLQQTVRSRKPVHFEEYRNGVFFESTCYPILDARGQVERVAVLARDVTPQKRAQEALQQEGHRLRRLLEMHERDRRLMAYEIHDGFVQALTGALMNLESGRQMLGDGCPEPACRSFDRAADLLRESLAEARRLMGGLGPSILHEFGLISAVDNLIFETQHNSDLEIEYSRKLPWERLAPPLEAALYRIVQESLNNVQRHSRSQKVRIRLEQRDDRVRVEVEDWGIGFDPRNVRSHCFGLEGIRERARVFGGEATIDAAPGKGTRVVVELPVVEE